MLALPKFGDALGLIAALFVAILTLVEIGRRLGVGREVDGLGGVERAVFGLMALLMAFTFSSAAVRFESRRAMIVEESNAIRAAFLRLDLLPAAAQPALRDGFRRYVDARLGLYRDLGDEAAARSDVARIAQIQGEIWQGAVAGCRDGGAPQAAGIVLPALNSMFAIAATRTMGLQTHQHGVVLGMLLVVMLASPCSPASAWGAATAAGSTW